MQNTKKLIEIFQEENSKINLSAIRDKESIYYKHILDSLEINNIIDFKKNETIIDFGTGGGFPLLPLAITNPQSKFIGLDSKNKKINAISRMIQNLKINNIELIRDRGENHIKKYDYLTARAVGYIDKLISNSYNLVKQGGYFIIMKQKDEQEIKDLEKVSKQYNINIEKIHKYKLFDKDINRVIFLLKK